MNSQIEELLQPRRCEKCLRKESSTLELFVTSVAPGRNPLLCKGCGDGDNTGLYR